MTDQVFSTLTNCRQNKDHPTWVFTDINDENHRKHASIPIRKAIKSIAGLEGFSLHDLRHCCASKLVNAV